MTRKPSAVWFLYVIRTRLGTLYTGVTTDVQRRFAEHNGGGRLAAKYLRGKGPLTLVFQRRVGTRPDALRAERKLKKLSKADKEALVQRKSLWRKMME